MNRILQDDANFLVELTDWQGQPAIRKTAKTTAPKTRVERMQNDVLGMRFFADLTQKQPGLALHVPAVFDSGPDFYIREFTDDPPVAREDMDLEEAKPRLDKLAELLARLDRLQVEEEVGYKGSSNYQNLALSISRWADENVTDKLISEANSKRVKEISAGLGQYLEPGIAHGDMSAYKHAYLRPDNKITLIDYENFSSRHARYYDTAWCFTRLYSFAKTAAIPKYFLSTFLAMAEPRTHQSEQLMAVLIQRTLGLQKDAISDLENKGVDFRDRAKELLGLVLENKLESLHG